MGMRSSADERRAARSGPPANRRAGCHVPLPSSSAAEVGSEVVENEVGSAGRVGGSGADVTGVGAHSEGNGKEGTSGGGSTLCDTERVCAPSTPGGYRGAREERIRGRVDSSSTGGPGMAGPPGKRTLVGDRRGRTASIGGCVGRQASDWEVGSAGRVARVGNARGRASSGGAAV